jgi:hypothetical protein
MSDEPLQERLGGWGRVISAMVVVVTMGNGQKMDTTSSNDHGKVLINSKNVSEWSGKKSHVGRRWTVRSANRCFKAEW